MTFWAQIRISEDETAQKLLQTFFKEFNPKSVIRIKDGNVFVKIFFDQTPPTEIAEAIGSYKDIEFSYGELVEDGNLQSKENDKQFQKSPTEVMEEALSVSNEVARPQEEEKIPLVEDEVTPPLAQVEEIKVKRNRRTCDKIPELDNIANNAMSFQDFLAKVVQWLGVEKKREYFIHLIEAATSIEKISWKNLDEKLKNNGIQTRDYDKIWTTKIIAKKLNEIQADGSILSVIKLVVDYRSFDFKGNIETKVRSILIKMGLDNYTTNQQEVFFQIANEGIKAIDVDLNAVCEKIGYLTEQQIDDAIMDFSTFVNSFFKENEKEMMKAKDFIQKLQKMVTTDGETLL